MIYGHDDYNTAAIEGMTSEFSDLSLSQKDIPAFDAQSYYTGYAADRRKLAKRYPQSSPAVEIEMKKESSQFLVLTADVSQPTSGVTTPPSPPNAQETASRFLVLAAELHTRPKP